MGPKKNAPLQGSFVVNQVDSIKSQLPADSVNYHGMAFNGDSYLHRLLKYPVFFLTFIFKFVFSSKRADLVHIHFYYPTIICAWLYKAFRNPNAKVIVSCHGGDIYWYANPPKLYRKLTSIVDHWIFTSPQLKSRFCLDVENYSILSAGIDDKVYQNECDSSKKTFDFLMVGAIEYNKGIDRLCQLCKMFPQATFKLVGGGDEVFEMVESLQSTCSNFEYLGVLTPQKLTKYMRQSKFLLSLSRHESFGLVIAEAGAVGTPCIATLTDGSLFQLGNWPFLTKQFDDDSSTIAALSELISKGLNLSNEEYYTIAEKAVALSQVHQLTSVTKKLMALYTELEREAVGV